MLLSGKEKDLKVLLCDVDSLIPNLALMKLSSYHKNIGNEIYLNKYDIEPDIVYASVVFSKNKYLVEHLKNRYNCEINIGGVGYDLKSKLLDKIEYMKPDYDLYPKIDYGVGFTTRGCNRNCYFCVVPKKEGCFRIHQHPENFYDERFNKILFLDNNILFDKKWFNSVTTWVIDHDLNVWFNQGLDIRLINEDDLKILSECKTVNNIEFAWDNIKDEDIVRKKIKLIHEYFDLRKVQFYVFINSDSEFEDGLYRCKELKKLGTNAFVMFNLRSYKTNRIRKLMRWANRKALFWSAEFEHYYSGNTKNSSMNKIQKIDTLTEI